MTGEQFKNLRRAADMSTAEFAKALGYEGSARTGDRTIRRYESLGRSAIPESAAVRAHAFGLEFGLREYRRLQKLREAIRVNR